MKKYGVVGLPKPKLPYRVSDKTTHLGIKEGYVVIQNGTSTVIGDGGTSNTLHYTRNYNQYIDTGIIVDTDWLAITEDYIYVSGRGSIISVAVDGWAYEAPDGRYVRLFAEKGLTNNYEYPIIGD